MTNYVPPNKDYLPPPPPPEFIPAIDEEIIDFELPHTDYLPPPSRGPQYVAPPRRNTRLSQNSHKPDRSQDLSDTYIPPKTKNDIPKNFIRPEDLPGLDDEDDLIEILDAELQATLDELGLDYEDGFSRLRDGTGGNNGDDNQKSR